MPAGRYRPRRVAVDQHRSLKLPQEQYYNLLQNDDHEAADSGRSNYCRVCNVMCTSKKDYLAHINGRRHRHTLLFMGLNDHRHSLVEDKCGIKVTAEKNFEVVESGGVISIDADEGKIENITLTVKNESKDILQILQFEFLKFMKEFKFDRKDKVPITLLPGEDHDIVVTFKSHRARYYKTPIAFLFNKESHEHKIHTIRYLQCRCTNNIIRALKPTAPYRRPKRVANVKLDLQLEEGYPLPIQTKEALERVIELKSYFIPKPVRININKDIMRDINLEEADINLREIIRGELLPATHQSKFHNLIYLEEAQMEVDIRHYDLEGVTMEKCSRTLKLLVPGLSENRPSVLKGDLIYVRHVDKEHKPVDNIEYKGYVHEIGLNDVLIGFSSKLHEKHIKGMKYNVRFTFSRTQIKLQHRAVDLAFENSLEDILFPRPETCCKMGTIIPTNVQLRLYDRQLESNEPQLTAVKHILSGTSRPAPYIVYGPPGTGKTVTIVESIKQIWKMIPGSHILACAPSNFAADIITQRLLKHVDKSDIYRMYAASRLEQNVPLEIKAICNWNSKSASFEFLEKEKLKKYRIIVCTLVTAGRLASASFPPGHFSHVFIDEAGHSVEPEALIAIAGIMETSVASKDGGQIVLAGDPKQLGPVLRSPNAKEFGLEKSLLERMMETEVYMRPERDETKPVEKRLQGYTSKYNTGPYNNNLVTKLVKNYRSHPALLKLPNEAFYENELQACADVVMREQFCSWEHLPQPGFPLIFHGVLGKNKREERSPSYFNAEEVSAVVMYVDKLCKERKIRVKEKDIGIIAPYRKQVQKIRQILKVKNYKDIQVGSTEEFQGQEKLVIIVSAVRSSEKVVPDLEKFKQKDPIEEVEHDVKFRLGFLQNPKRFNVAITRAKSLMIVIGNPWYLAKDEHWNSLLMYCIDKKAYIDNDCEYKAQETEQELEEVLSRIKKLALENYKKDLTQDDIPNEEPEWQRIRVY